MSEAARVPVASPSGRPEPRWLRAMLRRLVPADVRCAIRIGAGPTIVLGNRPPRFTFIVRSTRTLAALALRPTMLGIGEAFIDGDIEIEGELITAVEAAYRVASHTGGATRTLRRLADAIPHSRSRARDVAAHYDVSPEFYALFLDRHMLYTCAYHPTPDATLEEAQEAKLDLVCRKLQLCEDERLLDIGCGWGGMLGWAATRYGVHAHGITLSGAQAAWTARRLELAGLTARARVQQCDLYDLRPSTPFDKAVAMGVIEHIGVANYGRYFARVREVVRPGGLFLNQGITHHTTSPNTSGMAFLDRYVFPGGDLATIEHTLSAMRQAGLEVLHVEAIGRHYGPTLREWLARLVARRAAAITLVGERTYRIYVAYLAAAAVAFEAGWIDVHQILARCP